jgi:hypothetical protein
MKSNSPRLLAVFAAIAFVCLFMSSCRRAATKPENPVKDSGTKRPDQPDGGLWKDARDAFRFTRPSDDWTRFREFLPKFNSYLAKPDVMARLQLAEAQRKFLADEVHLTSAELADLEATEFRAADAHYLDECYLLRDAARSLEAASLDTAEKKAHALFRWVMRNVLLHEQVDTWIPPAFTLRRGYGSAVDRSLVCLALLRQEKLDGCLIVVPEKEGDPVQLLIAVPDEPSASMLLFDPRLGLAVKGKDGKSIATLKEVRADPKLLGPSQITPEQAKKLEAWLVCPYHALSPRMQELQGQLDRIDRIVLHQNPLSLSQDIAKLAELPVKAWNPPAQGSKVANSPTRCLELFLPKSEGGLDNTGRAGLIASTRVPVASVLANFRQINVTKDLLPVPVFNGLINVAFDFFAKYDLQPREMYLRGQYGAMRQRQERVLPLVQTDAFAGDTKFRDELAAWFKRINTANRDLEDRDPAVRAKAKQILDNLGGADYLLHWMRDVESEKKLDDVKKELRELDAKEPRELNIKEDHIRSVPTKILALGLRDHFDFELVRSQAAESHEKAERAQAALRAQAKPSAAVVKNAHEAWIMAKSAWANFYIARIPLEFTIDQRLNQMRPPRVRPDEVELRIGMLETVHLDVQRYFNAKSRLAECLVHTHPDGIKGANAYLAKTKAEIEQLEKKGLLRDEIKNVQDILPRVGMSEAARATYQRRLELLSHDWSERGSYFWLKQQFDQRAK